MKKILIVVALAVAVFGPAAAAQAEPSATLCHSVTVTVNGEDVVNDAACNDLPPQ